MRAAALEGRPACPRTFKVLKKISTTALSKQFPFPDIEIRMPCQFTRSLPSESLAACNQQPVQCPEEQARLAQARRALRDETALLSFLSARARRTFNEAYVFVRLCDPADCRFAARAFEDSGTAALRPSPRSSAI